MLLGSTAVRLTLLWVWSRHEGPNLPVELSGDDPFEAPPDLPAGLAFLGASGDVVTRGRGEDHATTGNRVQGLVQLSVPVSVEPVTDGVARGRGDGADPGHLQQSGCHGVHDPRQGGSVFFEAGGDADDSRGQASRFGSGHGGLEGVTGVVAPVTHGADLGVGQGLARVDAQVHRPRQGSQCVAGPCCVGR